MPNYITRAECCIDDSIDDLREYVKTRVITDLETRYHWVTHEDAPIEKWVLDAIQAWLGEHNAG